ncbi:MAG TPA: YbhN family protein [Pseudonocardia sp.]|nr:YbhN family protein [Pseudonocardia sp.]
MRRRHVLTAAAGIAAAGIAAKVLYDSSDEILTAADTLTQLRPGWVVLALVAEVVSYLLRGRAQAVVLRAGLAGLGPGPGAAPGAATRPAKGPGSVLMGSATLAGDAAAYCLPMGFAASGVIMIGVLRRRGVDAAVASWMFAICTGLYVGSISVMTIVAVRVAGDEDPVPGLEEASTFLLVGLAVLAAVLLVLRRTRAGRPERAVRSGRVRTWLAELRAIRLPALTGASAFAWMTGSWLADIAVLGIAYVAVGASPPWTGLLLAYCAGQIAAAVPLTPGGIGVVEGSLTLALVAFGGAATITLAAVLLYRLIAYWSCIPLGGLTWLALRRRAPEPRPVATADEPAVARRP